MAEVAGVRLDGLADSIKFALYTYQEMTDGLEFDIENASQLELTPDKPNSARSHTEVQHLGETVCGLYVIAFNTGDGSGDESFRRAEDLTFAKQYPAAPKSVPRSKKGTGLEIIMPLVSIDTDSDYAGPELFGGTYDLLGLINGNSHVTKIGELGQDPAKTKLEMPVPLAMQTVGVYHDKVAGDSRFGDPHAIYSATPNKLQVCAFVAVTIANDLHPDALQGLQAEMPRDLLFVK